MQVFTCGIGFLIPLTKNSVWITELNYETPRHEGAVDFFQLMAGPEIKFMGHRSLRIALGINLNRYGAPTSEMMMGGGSTF